MIRRARGRGTLKSWQQLEGDVFCGSVGRSSLYLCTFVPRTPVGIAARSRDPNLNRKKLSNDRASLPPKPTIFAERSTAKPIRECPPLLS